MKITVKSSQFWDDVITVQRFETCDEGTEDEYKDLIWCNHGGAYEEEVENTFMTFEGPTSYTSKVTVCDKCPAFLIPGEGWENAPMEGIK